MIRAVRVASTFPFGRRQTGRIPPFPLPLGRHVSLPTLCVTSGAGRLSRSAPPLGRRAA